MLSRRLGAVVFGASTALAVAAGAACSQSYAENGQADAAAPDATATDDAPPAEAAVDADAATVDAQKPQAFLELASGLTDLAGVTATDTTVYFTERGPGNVKSVPIGGGMVSEIAAATGAPGAIVAAGGFLFWADGSGVKLIRRTIDDGTMISMATPGKTPHAMAAAADRIVVVALTGVGTGEVDQYLFDLTPGPSIGGLANPWDVAVTGSDIYWTESSGSRIGKGTTGSTTNGTFALAEPAGQSIAANAAGVYWTRPDDGLVRSASGANGAASLADTQIGPSSVTADETDVYWLTSDGTLRRKTIGQELPPATLATGLKAAFVDTHVRAIALTPKYVVWITSDGRVLRLEK